MNPTQLLIGAVSAALIAFIAHRMRALSHSGAIATFALGTIVFGLGGIAYSVPLITFFVLSSALSRIGRARKQNAEALFEKGGRRDAGQVLANGGIAGLLVLLNAVSPSPAYFIAYLGALAAATADTWGTEIGLLGRGKVISLITLREVEPGRSGGVSVLGTIGALAGAAITTVSGIGWTAHPIRTLIVATTAGIMGMLVDSVVGATLQAQYRCGVCGRTTERRVHCGEATELTRGFRLITNDAVNVACCASGALCALALSR